MPEKSSPIMLSLGLSNFRLAADLLFNSENDCDQTDRLNVGDLIEVDRTLYAHWVLYIGDGSVIHVVGEDDQDIPDTEYAVVKEAKLIEVAANSYIRVNNKEVPAKERRLVAFDNETTVANAKKFVGLRVEYNLLTKNCEHYLTEWKYGKSWSDQAAVALNAIKTLKKDSSSAGHAFLVNGLNTLLNSPGANNLPSSPQFPRSPTYSISSTTSSTGSQTEPVA
ncbi:HRAS-like suppressor 3 [Leptotrombidium deliense]|uniref:HRAS-like suppressor 3 n=1 Tax=Leptotrombidium deliense TaxID=299467 RepID=A0A443SQ92_9ACAR|nr:HRAS-like suppressor 3 [Leptotrombidium deliense]